MSKKRTQEPQLDPAQVAILHRTGRQWRVLLGSTRNRKPSIVTTRAFAESEADAMRAWLTEQKVGRAICVLPASSVICRTCTLPVAEPDQLEQALQLQAEAYLPGETPRHRVAIAVLPASMGETSRSGILITWPESAKVVSPRTDCPKTFAPDIAGLAALINGYRPPDPLIWLDRHAGAIALAITHANGAIFRCTREEAEDAKGWQKSVTQTLAETALSVGHTGPFVQGLLESLEPRITALGDEETALFLPPDIRRYAFQRLANLHADEQWWSEYGVAAGVFLAATSGLSELTELKEAPEVAEPTALSRIASALSKPRNAAVVAVACLLLLGLSPLAMSAARLGVLKLRHPDIDQQTAAIDEIKRQRAIYRVLADESWSMTKVLSDVVSNTPEGIELEFVRVNRSDSSFHVRGEAKPYKNLEGPELVGRMQQHLHESMIFQKTDVKLAEPNNYRVYPFELSAKVVKPHRQQPYEFGGERDFENWTLAERQRGDPPPKRGDTKDEEPEGGATRVASARDDGDRGPTIERVDPPTGETPDENESTRRASHSERFRGSGDGAFAPPGEPTLPPSLAIPEPLTIEQIRAMSKNEAQSHLAEIARARNAIRRSDPEGAARLQKEWELIFARLRDEL